MEFFYDANGVPFSMLQNRSTMYYYVTNLEGDVIRLVDGYGNIAAMYKYDPFGREIYAYGSHAQINPLRYRSYYYDADTEMYYVSSWYYDPEVGRFNSVDTTDILGATSNFYDKNQYAYCGNNPVNRRDVGGYAWETVFDIVSLEFSIAEVAANPYDIGAWIGLAGDAIDLIPIVTGVGETVRGIRFVDKAGNTLEIVEAVDFTDDARKVIDSLENVNGFTKSTKMDGIKIHNQYKVGPGFSKSFKEYKEVDGIRPDYYDGSTIFELKPFNPKSAKAGIKQWKTHNSKLGSGKVMRLELY